MTRRFAFSLFFLSGGLALLYEVIWLRLLVLVLGSTQFAITSVVTAFMAGLALGSFLFGRYIDRTRRNPLVVYAALEIGIALSALAVPYALEAFGALARATNLFGGSIALANIVRFLLALLVLLLPTTLMGGTLPVLTRFVTRREGEAASSLGTLYAINTLGAVVGTTITGLWLIPRLGVSATIWLAVAGNALLGALALVIARAGVAQDVEPAALPSAEKAGNTSARARRAEPSPTPLDPHVEPNRVALWAGGLSGLLSLVYEIAWTRVLTLILGSTVYAFTAMLATFLAGLAAGAFIGGWLAERLKSAQALLRALAVTIACGACMGYVSVLLFPRLPAAFARTFNAWGLASPGTVDSGARALQLVSIEFVFAFLVMFPATVCMGVVFPLVAWLWVGRRDLAGEAVGTVYGASTVGSILGSILCGFVILPLAGIQGGILIAVGAGLLLAAALTWTFAGWTRGRSAAATAAAAGLFAVFVLARPSWDPVVMNSGIYQYAPDLRDVSLSAEEFAAITHDKVEVVSYEEGLTANVLVGRNPTNGNVWLSINGKIDASTGGDLETQLLLGHLPMLFAPQRATPEERKAAVIGYATGITTGSVTRYRPGDVATVEIEGAVFRASKYFDAHNHNPLANPVVRPIVADGRTFLLADPTPYDVIVSEPSSPWMTIAANLFTREFFEIGRRRLAPGGIFCQWIQLYGLPQEDLKSLMRTFMTVFPNTAVFWGIPGQDIILLGSDAPIPVDLARIAETLRAPDVAADLARIHVRTPEDLLAYYITDDRGARAFVGDAPLNTDDNARIEFRAPLSMHTWADTLKENARALRALAVDPLTRVSGVPDNPVLKAASYVKIGESFYNRRMFDRAIGAVKRALELYPAPEGYERLAAYEKAAQAAGEE